MQAFRLFWTAYAPRLEIVVSPYESRRELVGGHI
jgi:hypothetical protein